jgi:prepilin-type N-terminal cleavage/methylation domain-containing protein
MDWPKKTTRGFTLVEVLIGLSIMVLIASFAVVGFRNYAQFQQYNQAISDVVFILNQTRLSARSAEDDAAHGVKFSSGGMTQFIGDTYVVGDPDNVLTTYGLVTLQHDLSGGVDEIVFEKLTGLPTATGTVTIEGVDFTASTTIEITSTGVVQ